MKRILLMDDSEIFLAVIRRKLEEAGYEVTVANDLESFTQARHEKPVDLVLMDVQMPEAFGDDVAMTLRFAHNVETPIYLLSSLSDDELRERADEAQINGFISKNWGVERIIQEIRNILNKPAKPPPA